MQKHRKAHAPICEQLSKSIQLPDQTHAGTKYPVWGNPSLRCRYVSMSVLFSVIDSICSNRNALTENIIPKHRRATKPQQIIAPILGDMASDHELRLQSQHAALVVNIAAAGAVDREFGHILRFF